MFVVEVRENKSDTLRQMNACYKQEEQKECEQYLLLSDTPTVYDYKFKRAEGTATFTISCYWKYE